jgi:hypothetical protein
MSATPTRTLDRADLAAALLIAAAALGAGVYALCGPVVVGLWEDDGVYLATSKAIADGLGYRHPELPGTPLQTKYPIAYPALLSLIWKLAPFPQNVAHAQALNVLLLAAGGWLAYLLLRRDLRLPALWAAAAVVLMQVNPYVVDLQRTTMSEPLYLLVSMGALYLAGRAPLLDPAAPGRRQVPLAAACGALAGLAYMTRGIGLSIAPAVVLWLALRRRWRPALVAGGAAVLVAGAWQAWRAWATAANALDPRAALFAYELDYGAWLTRGLAAVGHVAYHNTSDLLAALLVQTTQPSGPWFMRSLQAGLPGALPLYVAAVGITVLLLAGFLITLRRTPGAVHLYLAAYLVCLLVWPFGPQRFLVPLLPLLFALLLIAIHGVLRPLAAIALPSDTTVVRPAPRRAGFEAAGRWGCSSLAGAGVCVLAGLLVLHMGRLAFDTRRWTTQAREFSESRELARLIREQTPPNAVIATGQIGLMHLLTDRKCVPIERLDDPIARNYPADRQFLLAGYAFTSEAHRLERAWIEQTLLDYYDRVGVTHVVQWNTREGGAGILKDFIAVHHARFVPIIRLERVTVFAYRPER